MLLKSERATVVTGPTARGRCSVSGPRPDSAAEVATKAGDYGAGGTRWRSPACPTPPIINVMSEL